MELSENDKIEEKRYYINLLIVLVYVFGFVITPFYSYLLIPSLTFVKSLMLILLLLTIYLMFKSIKLIQKNTFKYRGRIVLFSILVLVYLLWFLDFTLNEFSNCICP
jgi:hypothetical protein